jgi:hypothetical protein
VTVVERPLGTSLAATVRVTEPGPLPVAGATPAHVAPDEADHEQPACVFTGIVAVPPSGAIATIDDGTVKVHAAASWLTETD